MNKVIDSSMLKTTNLEVLEIYEDSLGYLTLGVGHLIQKGDPEYGQPTCKSTPVSQEVVDLYYDNDFDKHVEETLHVCENNNIDFDSLPENAQHTLVDWCVSI